MKKANKIITVLVLLLALLVAGAVFTVSAAEGDLETKYGTVPAANASDSFAVFHKAPGESEYSFNSSSSNPFNATTYALEGDVAILMLKDVDWSAASSISLSPKIKSNLIIDLGGHTLTQVNQETGTFTISPSAITGDTEQNITITNGYVHGQKDFILTGYGAADLGTYSLVQNLTLDHLTFTRVKDSNYANAIIQVITSTTVSTLNVLYNECVMDFRGIAAGSTLRPIMSDRGDSSSQTINSVFKGGEMIFDSITGVQLPYGSNVTFAKGENGYFKLTTAVGDTVSYSTLVYDEANVVLTKVDADDTNACYQPVSLETEYATIPSDAASPYDFPFIIFTKATDSDAWSYLRACDDTTNDPWVSGNIDRYCSFDGEVVILMRRDVDFSSRSTCANCLKIRNMTLDMNGYSLRSTDASGFGLFWFATLSTADYGGSAARNWTFKNGTVITGTSQFMLFAENQAMTEAPNVNVTFDGITFDRAEGATKEQPFVQMNNCPNYAHTANVNYDDCTFDIRGEFVNKTYLFTVCNKATSKLTANVRVNGGTILTDTTDKLQIVLHGASCPGSIKFNKGEDGEYVKLVVANSGTFNNTETFRDDNNTPFNFRAAENNGTETTYRLCPVYLINYVPKMSMTLSSDLIYNVYLPKDKLVSFTLGGVKYTNLGDFAINNIGGEDYYHVTVKNGVLKAGNEFSLEVEVNVGGATSTATRTLGILKYAKNLLAGSPTEAEAAVIKDMLAYVKAACQYANTNEDTVTEIEAIIGADYVVAPDTDAVEVKESVEGLDGAAMYLREYPGFIFYPETDANGNLVYAAENYSFKIGSTTVDTEITEVDGRTCILVRTYAYAMTDTVTYSIEGTEITGEYNLASYLKFAEEQGTEALVALLKALWQYSASADAYRAEVVG